MTFQLERGCDLAGHPHGPGELPVLWFDDLEAPRDTPPLGVTKMDEFLNMQTIGPHFIAEPPVSLNGWMWGFSPP